MLDNEEFLLCQDNLCTTLTMELRFSGAPSIFSREGVSSIIQIPFDTVEIYVGMD